MSQKPVYCPPTLAEWAHVVRNNDDPTFIINDVIPHDSLVLLSGEPKDAKKTWFAMKLALLAATGRSETNLVVNEPVRVHYIYREGAEKATLNRFDVLLKSQGLRPEELTNLYFHHRGGFFLDDADAVGEVVKFVTANDIKLVIIDTFAKSCRADENSAREMGLAVAQAEKLRDAGATVLLVHHVRKGGPSLSNGKSGTPEPDKDLRGSSALAGAYEMHLAVRSFAVPGQREKEEVVMIGGKEADWVAYTYAWDFQKETNADGAEVVKSVLLTMSKLATMPFIAEPSGRRRSGEEEGIAYV